ncbi:hypothetical protein [Pantoea cypripedii]|uniref:hypothetical protein n=1 Tax=Pantoea cypripedii TaxID=55209 RepID=UPI00130209C2|nr:hypothetical protein [Pantoea cypripedii]
MTYINRAMTEKDDIADDLYLQSLFPPLTGWNVEMGLRQVGFFLHQVVANSSIKKLD